MNKPRILVVDDDPTILDLAAAALNKGFDVVTAEDAHTARQALEEGGVELVLCDWMLPDVNGDKLLGWAKQSPALRHIPFVMVTARDDKEFVVTAIRLGADGYLIKPFTPERLRTKIHSVLDKQPHGDNPCCAATLQFRNQTVKGRVKAYSGDQVVVGIPRDKFPPHVFEEVQLHLEPGGGNPYGVVTTLQAEGLAVEAATVEVHIRLRELSDDHRAQLTQLATTLEQAAG